MSIKEVFETRKNDPRWNTSYPLSPTDWAAYRVPSALPFATDRELSFYIHIPFCRQLCSFCEYTRMLCPDDGMQKHYIEVIASDIKRFKSKHSTLLLKGFDIGGGTPTSLTEGNFDLLMAVYDEAVQGVSLATNYEPSIEGTFSTLSEHKLERMVESGFRRLSLGIQSTDSSVLCAQHRERIAEDNCLRWIEKAHAAGINKVNLDLMYGLKGQNEATIDHDLLTIKRLSPQQVTLYELRTNMISTKDIPSKGELFALYQRYFDGLTALGYHAKFGQNTFSLCASDLGVSSYLRTRMLNGTPYKGFGISAQSMSSEGIAYNCGKNSAEIKRLLARTTYEEDCTYLLPSHELASKYIAISGYYGGFSLKKLRSLAGETHAARIEEALNFCLDKQFLSMEGPHRVRITQSGFLYYGAILSLFHSL